MVDVFIQNPLLLLFIVVGFGYLIGNIKILGTKLGVSSVLFVGLGIGALDQRLILPEIILFLGLAIFVYSIGLSNGQRFFHSLRGKEKRNLNFIFVMFLFVIVLTAVLHFMFGFESEVSSGLYAGSGTSSAALAGLLNVISQDGSISQQNPLDNAVIGYSLAYPFGVIGVMIAIVLMEKWLKIDYKQEEKDLNDRYPMNEVVNNIGIRILNDSFCGIPLRDLKAKNQLKVIFGRLKRNDKVSLTNWDTVFQKGDIVRIGGSQVELDKTIQLAGELFEDDMDNGASAYISKRIFVSNPDVVGKRLDSLNLYEKFSAIITRVQRGDTELLAKGGAILELGDRIRFIARQKDLKGLTELFGNSYHSLSHINLFSFGIGIALGLLLGMVTFEFPGGISFQLGYAGGPLVVALILGAIRRTGPILWTLPYSASLTLRQIGLIFLLAAVGIRSGHTFFQILTEGGAIPILIAAFILTFVAMAIMLWVGYKWFNVPFSLLTGMVANQPAILDFSTQRSGNQLPSVGFALMFPIGLIIKILMVQLLYIFLG